MLERKPINGGLDPTSPDHALDQNLPWTSPPRSPTLAPAAAAPSPTQAFAIRRGATRWGGERGGPEEARIRGRPLLGSRSGANCDALPCSAVVFVPVEARIRGRLPQTQGRRTDERGELAAITGWRAEMRGGMAYGAAGAVAGGSEGASQV